MRQSLQLLVLLPVLLGVLGAGASVLMRLERAVGWSWADAIYFCFTTLTTIGYGNFTPMVRQPSSTSPHPPPCWPSAATL